MEYNKEKYSNRGKNYRNLRSKRGKGKSHGTSRNSQRKLKFGFKGKMRNLRSEKDQKKTNRIVLVVGIYWSKIGIYTTI